MHEALYVRLPSADVEVKIVLAVAFGRGALNRCCESGAGNGFYGRDIGSRWDRLGQRWKAR